MPTNSYENFFSQIIYSSANEDGRSELTCLDLNENDHAITITGSGARALDLLISPVEKVTAIDFNKGQNELLSLKISALKYLDNEDYLIFLGLVPADERTRLYLFQSFEKHLDKTCKEFWNARLPLIAKGVLFCGVWEKYLIKLAKFSFFKKKTLEKIWQAKTLEEQFSLWNSEWKGPFWNTALKIISYRFVWKYILKEPGINLVPLNFDIYHYLKERFDQLFSEGFVRNSFFAKFIFTGALSHTDVLPLHLQKENLNTIRNRLNRIEIVHADLEQFLNDKKNKNRFSAFSLSDFSSYAPERTYQNIWQGVKHSGKAQARICERQFLVKRNPADYVENLVRNAELEQKLQKTDSSFIYSFVCAQFALP